MTATPTTELKGRRQNLKNSVDAGEVDEADAEAISEFIRAHDPNNLMDTPRPGDSTLSTGSCNIYLSRLTEAARHFTLTDASIDDVNAYLQELKDEGKADDTVNGYSTAFRRFYRYYDLGVDPEGIARVKRSNGSAFDPDDVLTRDEIHDMLDAADNTRDRAIFALLIYTGMRNNALRTLRIKDVDVQEGTWTFNDEAEGLKGADENGQKRPLLGARGPVRDWLKFHPYKDDPDAMLISGKPKYLKETDNPYKPVDGSTVRRVLDKLTENTDNPAIQEKPTHPHMMRHNFVTVCKRDYELPDETVKFLIGHTPGSNVMETTYSHLSDEDHIERAEVAAGIKNPTEDEGIFTPQACPMCAEPLPADAKACTCGHTFAPDAQRAQTTIQESIKKSYREADPDDEEVLEGLDAIDRVVEDRMSDLLSDPEFLERALEQAEQR